MPRTLSEPRPPSLIVVGAGILGLSTAWTWLKKYPGARVSVLEKEQGIARHQTGRNSGVVHSGIYYKPGSLKAETCLRGRALLERFCVSLGVAYERCGKVIVATHEPEVTRLRALEQRGKAHGLAVRWLTPEQLRELEPHVAGTAGLHVPETGIVDYVACCGVLREHIELLGGQVVTGAEVTNLSEDTQQVRVETRSGSYSARLLMNCSGLHSDRLAARMGLLEGVRIIPFRGEYYALKGEAARLCRNLIYPVPDPDLPFLGVHLTRRISGVVEAGPNAVLALAREGYSRSRMDLRDLFTLLTFPGFYRMAWRHRRTGVEEVLRSLRKAAFAKSLQRLVPRIRAEDLEPHPAGVRAQAVSADGRLLDDFVFAETALSVHVVNAPSPAATACFAIAERLVAKLAERS